MLVMANYVLASGYTWTCPAPMRLGGNVLLFGEAAYSCDFLGSNRTEDRFVRYQMSFVAEKLCVQMTYPYLGIEKGKGRIYSPPSVIGGDANEIIRWDCEEGGNKEGVDCEVETAKWDCRQECWFSAWRLCQG